MISILDTIVYSSEVGRSVCPSILWASTLITSDLDLLQMIPVLRVSLLALENISGISKQCTYVEKTRRSLPLWVCE